MQSESEEGGSDIDLLYEVDTEERNGVKVIVPIKDYWDKSTFLKKIKEQLCYFQNVYFKVEDIDNDFSIYRGEDFQRSELCPDEYMHICLDDVYYPIDWSKLDLSSIKIPIGLRFSLNDGIVPVPNREQIRYTKEAIAIILDKITKIADFFVTKYNEQISGTNFSLFSAIDHYGYNKTVTFENLTVDIDKLRAFSDIDVVDPKVDNIKLLNFKRIWEMKDFFIQNYKVTHTFSSYNRRFTSTSRDRLSYRYIKDKDITLYIHQGEFCRKKQNYLRDELKGYHWFLTKRTNIPLKSKYNGSLEGWDNILQLNNYPKSKWRDIIKEALWIQKQLVKDFIDLDKIEIPKEYFEKKKKEKVAKIKANPAKKEKLEGEISCKLARSPQRYLGNGTHFVYDTITINLKNIHKEKIPYIFYEDTENNKSIVNEYYTYFNGKVIFIALSNLVYNRLKDLNNHHWVSLDNFIKGDLRISRKKVTASVIYKDLIENENFRDVISENDVMYRLNIDLYEKIKKLKQYCNDYIGYRGLDHIPESTEMYQNIYDARLWDYSVWDLYKEVKNILEKNSFLNTLLDAVNSPSKDMLKIMRDICKYYKFRTKIKIEE